MSRYHEVYKSWHRDPESFWADAASDIHWHKPFGKVFDEKAGDRQIAVARLRCQRQAAGDHRQGH